MIQSTAFFHACWAERVWRVIEDAVHIIRVQQNSHPSTGEQLQLDWSGTIFGAKLFQLVDASRIQIESFCQIHGFGPTNNRTFEYRGAEHTADDSDRKSTRLNSSHVAISYA